MYFKHKTGDDRMELVDIYNHKNIFERLFDKKSYEPMFMIFLAILIGIFGGFITAGFSLAVKYSTKLFYSAGNDITHGYYKALIPALGGIIVGIIRYYFVKPGEGLGIPQVLYSLVTKEGKMSPRLVAIMGVSSIITLGSGGSAGKEGPIVHIGAGIGSMIGKIFKLEGLDNITLLGCGAAACIAGIFNAPIAGVFFALEIILHDFTPRTFGAIVVSAVTGSTISRIIFGEGSVLVGNHTNFQIPAYELRSYFELPLYALLGIFTAIIAVIFIFSLIKFEKEFKKIKIPFYLKPALGGLFVGIIGLKYPQVLGLGINTIADAFSGKLLGYTMFILIFLKILAVSFTLGSGGAGGDFTPSLVVGSVAGGAFEVAMHHLFPGIVAPTGAYATVGMGALLAAMLHAPMTGIFIIFELTDSYAIILPIMIACVTSNTLARVICEESIYSYKMLLKGKSYKRHRETNVIEYVTIDKVMIKDVVTVSENMKIPKLIELIRKSEFHGFPVVDKDNLLCGIVTYDDVRLVLKENKINVETVKDIMTSNVLVIYPFESMREAFQKFGVAKIGRLPVVSQDNPRKILGWVSRTDLIKRFNQISE